MAKTTPTEATNKRRTLVGLLVVQLGVEALCMYCLSSRALTECVCVGSSARAGLEVIPASATPRSRSISSAAG